MTAHRPEDTLAAPSEPVPCPFCDARAAELVSLFGCQLMTSHYRCRACGSYFEAVRPNLRGESKLERDDR